MASAHLTLGRLLLDRSEDEAFRHHGSLFLPAHLAKIPYYYEGDADDEALQDLPLVQRKWGSYRVVSKIKDGYSAPLQVVTERLALLGYTDEYFRQFFDLFDRYRDGAHHDFTFDAISSIFKSADFSDAAIQEREGSYRLDEFLADRILPQFGKDIAARLRLGEYPEVDGITETFALHMLSQNPTARDLPVRWQFADVVEEGYAKPDAFRAGIHEDGKYLIVTEGTSDSQIIRHALNLLRPDVADFFNFVDMQDNYPFSGTGNLFKFIQGLVSIRIKNETLVIFDNDAEGAFNWERAKKLTPLDNLKIMKLPDIKRFKRFRTVGPTGQRITDINGKAAAIECYLDVGASPVVRWTNYISALDCYQGHIVEKHELAKAFLQQRTRQEGYDYSGLEAVLELIINTCAQSAARDMEESLKNVQYL